MALLEQFKKWKEQTDLEKVVLIDANEEKGLLTITIEDKLLKISCPKTTDAIFVVESEEKTLIELITSLNSYALDRAGKLTVTAFLNKCATLYQKSKQTKPDELDDDAWAEGGEGEEIGRAVQQECRDRSRMPSSA
eukprot:TRINITY_DN5822_c0_g1_i3.p1 TRINITY_DN5822_c0_g1~~TRINITY_DN5822_c0_g1_i3.p1  ORF type:complete len:136 (+),score=32.75 TRINITY_DN5822_c0_g1_i3:85-492(+)